MIVTVALCVLVAAFPVSAEGQRMAVANMYGSEGRPVGVATLVEVHDGVRIVVHVFNLPPGYHALHIHDAGSCEAPQFKSAMGHFNPYGKQHGLQNPEGPHAGDLPNILVGPDGTGYAIALAPNVTLGPGVGSLFKEGGTAMMIHEGQDDHMSDPAGAAGKRIACGVIEAWDQ